MRARIVLAMLVLAGASGLTRAQDKPLERADLDKRIVLTVYESARLGTDLFNKGGHAECFRLYQGTVMAVVPLLDHRPKLQASAKARLDKAAKMEPAKGAFELRAALDEIQNEIAPPKGGEKGPKLTLWDRLGGEKGVRVVVHDVVLAAAEDKAVNFLRDGKVKLDQKGIAHLEQMLVEQISEATGGPLNYTGRSMKDVHRGMMITDKEFDALGAILVATLKKHKVAQAEIDELVKIVESTRADIVEKK
jgi:hemoglobin